jgi:hypothetical protein
MATANHCRNSAAAHKTRIADLKTHMDALRHMLLNTDPAAAEAHAADAAQQQ